MRRRQNRRREEEHGGGWEYRIDVYWSTNLLSPVWSHTAALTQEESPSLPGMLRVCLATLLHMRAKLDHCVLPDSTRTTSINLFPVLTTRSLCLGEAICFHHLVSG